MLVSCTRGKSIDGSNVASEVGYLLRYVVEESIMAGAVAIYCFFNSRLSIVAPTAGRTQSH